MKSNTPEPVLEAVGALLRGEVIVFPTETVYGLGADALNAGAVERIYAIKGRDAANPIPVLVSDQAMLRDLVTSVSATANLLIERFWPGPLTLVLPARPALPRPLLNARGGIGVRISSHPLAAGLVKALGRPLTATSANPSGQDPARSVDQAKAYFAGQVNIYIDGGTLTSAKRSTVVEVLNDRINIIREGEITAVELERCLAAR